MAISQRQPWGTVGAQVEVASFIPAVKENHVSAYGNISLLVNVRQLATSYRYFLFFGASYTFGSIFSPIVNPRFSGGS